MLPTSSVQQTQLGSSFKTHCLHPTPRDSGSVVRTGGQGLCILGTHAGDSFSGNQHPENNVPGALRREVGAGGSLGGLQEATSVRSILLAERANGFHLRSQLRSDLFIVAVVLRKILRSYSACWGGP